MHAITSDKGRKPAGVRCWGTWQCNWDGAFGGYQSDLSFHMEGTPPYWSTAWIDFLVMHFILPLWRPENLNGLVCSKLCYPYTHLSWSGSWLDSRPHSSLAVSHFKWPGWVTRLSVSHCTMCNFYSPGSTPAVDPIGIFQVVSGWLRSLHKFQVSCFTFLCFTELQSWVFCIDINA